MLHIPDTTIACPIYPPADPAIAYTFPLDPFQQWAVAAIHKEENVLVTAKTGSGKTLVGEYQIAYTLRQGKRIFYTTPIKSLSNQKYHDLKHLFPDASVGILTGDIKSNPDAQIVVMTTEILRNLLFKQSTATATLGIAGTVSLEGVGAVIFDEVHYINDADRGHVWEECLILMPPEIRLVMLSATIENPEGLAGWLAEIKQVPMHLLKTTYRIVPLVHSIYREGLKTGEELVLKTRDESAVDMKVYRDWLQMREKRQEDADAWKKTVHAAKRAGESAAGREGKVRIQSFPHRLNECITTLQTRDLLPALFFVFSRKECERYAEKVTGSLITSSETADVKHILSFHLHRYMDVLETLPQYHQVKGLLERGIAFHHSGVLPLLKEAIEILFVRGFIKVMFATETFAVGLNMPTRTVIFTDLKKPAGGNAGFRPLRYDEYAQMAGRAGRRGKDTRGYVFYMPARDPLEPDELKSTMSGSLVPLTSRIQFHYDFVLKAIHMNSSASSSTENDGREEPIWKKILEKSYWSIQRDQTLQEYQKEYETAKAVYMQQKERLTDAQRAAIEEKDMLEMQVKTCTNSKQKQAKLALRRWIEEHTGSVWTLAATSWEREKQLAASYNRLESILKDATAYGSEQRITPILGALRAWNYLDEEGRLTHQGVLATEVNEGNPMMMTELYTSGLLRDATAEEIISVLGCFIGDREAREKTSSHELSVSMLSESAKSAFAFLQKKSEEGESIDRTEGVESPEDFWIISPFWMFVVKEWMEGQEACVLTTKYELYEGNLMRGLLKIANLLDEWIAIATFCGDVQMLDKLRDIPTQLLRGIAQPESLYLRL